MQENLGSGLKTEAPISMGESLGAGVLGVLMLFAAARAAAQGDAFLAPAFRPSGRVGKSLTVESSFY